MPKKTTQKKKAQAAQPTVKHEPSQTLQPIVWYYIPGIY